MFEEQALSESKPMVKGVMEFFLNIARRVCEKLGLPIVVGNCAFGKL